MHPLDLVKVRFQLAETPNSFSPSTPSLKGKERALPTSSTLSAPNASSTSNLPTGTALRPRFGTGVYRALEEAVKIDGWRGLYRGLGPNLVGGASSWGLYFLL
jgi:solute carrier family 25 folate transporter 32